MPKKAEVSTEVVSVEKRKRANVGPLIDWKAEMAQYAARTVKMEEATQTGNRISTRGGRLTYHDTPLKNNEMHVLILGALIENVYYPDKFDPDNPVAPVCFAFSEDGEDMAPHEKAHEKQNPTCNGCPRNEWGTADTGKGKACKNVRRLAVMPVADELSLDVIDTAEIATLGIPVTSVRGYSAYVKELASSMGLPPFAWKTRIWLEPDPKSQFKVCFQTTDRRPIPEKFYPSLIKRAQEAQKLLDVPYVWVDGNGAAAPAPKRKGKAKF